MTITYFGKNESNKHRIACIEANMNKEAEEVVSLEKMAKLLAIRGYHVDESVHGILIVPVDSVSEYNILVFDYKELKKSISMWKKFGF